VGAQVRWSSKALSALAAIRDYIERDSTANSVHVGRQITTAARRAGSYPLSGRVIEQWKNPNLREVIAGSYRVMYHVVPGKIKVFDVRHTRRRVPKRFRKEWLE
jgi:toxin ParE1/3/4